jgi:hypothetical protein
VGLVHLLADVAARPIVALFVMIKQGFPHKIACPSLFISLTMVKGLAGARRSSAHENWIHDVVRRFHLNTTESCSPLTTHGVNHVPSSSAHRKPLISVDTILGKSVLIRPSGVS